MPVVTLEEIEPFLPAPLTIPQRTMVEDLIDLVEGELAQLLNRPIEVSTFTEEEYVVNLTEPTLVLLNSPVVSVEEVKADGDVVDAAMYTVRKWGLDFGGFNTLALVDPVIWTPSNAHFTWWSSPDVYILATGSYPQGVWTVSYTAGLDGPNINAIRSVLIKAIRREIADIFQGYGNIYSSMKVEDYSWTKNPKLMQASQGVFTENEVAMLNNLVRKSIVA